MMSLCNSFLVPGLRSRPAARRGNTFPRESLSNNPFAPRIRAMASSETSMRRFLVANEATLAIPASRSQRSPARSRFSAAE